MHCSRLLLNTNICSNWSVSCHIRWMQAMINILFLIRIFDSFDPLPQIIQIKSLKYIQIIPLPQIKAWRRRANMIASAFQLDLELILNNEEHFVPVYFRFPFQCSKSTSRRKYTFPAVTRKNKVKAKAGWSMYSLPGMMRKLCHNCKYLASFAASPFSVLCHTVNKIKYGKNWRNKERKNEPSKKKESLPR